MKYYFHLLAIIEKKKERDMNLDIAILKDGDQRMLHNGYKYLIKKDGMAYSAYRTDQGFAEWLKRNRLKMRCANSEFSKNWFVADCELYEKFFWDIKELPENAAPFMGLCNATLLSQMKNLSLCGSQIQTQKMCISQCR